MSKFKPGDLAVIIGTTGALPETVGRCVELMIPSTSREGESQWIWRGCPAGYATLERHLMPLRDDFQPEQEKAKEVKA